jgi:integrase
MAIFKKTRTKPLPTGAEVSSKGIVRWKDAHGRTRTGKLTADGCGVLVESGMWTATYRDGRGRLVTCSTGCKSKDGAVRKLQEFEATAEKVRCGVLSHADAEAAEHSHGTISEAIKAYDAHLQTAGRAQSHYAETKHLLDLAVKGCGWQRVRDLDAKRAAVWLETIRETGLSDRAREAGKGLAARTVNKYGGYLKSFGGWLQRTGRTVGNPFDTLPTWSVADDRRHTRRAFTPEELAAFLVATEARPERDLRTIQKGKHKGQLGAKVDPKHIAPAQRLGRERALCWRTLAYTGLRIGELRALRICDVILQGDKPRVELPAKHAKNRRGATLPLRADLAALLGAWLGDRLRWEREAAQTMGKPIPARLEPLAKLFPHAPASVKVFDADLVAAGLASRDANGIVCKVDDRGRVLDIHSLRGTFASMLSAAGVPLVTAQHLMRHSDPKLTANVYTDAHLLDLPGAVAKLPDMLPKELPQVAQAVAGDSAAWGGEKGAIRGATKWAVVGGKRVHIESIADRKDTFNEYNATKNKTRKIANRDKGIRVLSTPDHKKKW